MSHLKDLVNSFFRQFKYIGIFLDINKYKESHISDDIVETIKAVYRLTQLIDEAGLKIEFSKPIPVIYNIPEWSPNFPVAGYLSDNKEINLSQFVELYWITWNYQITNFKAGRTYHLRFLRGALYLWQKHSPEYALHYLIDLYSAGIILDIEVTFNCIIDLLEIYSKSKDDSRMPELFFTIVPISDDEWINASLRYSSLEALSELRDCKTYVSKVLEYCLLLIEEVRESNNYDEWLSGQMRLYDITRLFQSLVKRYIHSPSISLRAIISQIEEIRADGGMIKILQEPYLAISEVFSLYRGLFLMIKSNAPSNWRDVTINERAFIPRKIADLFFNNAESYPKEWSMASPELAVAIFIASKHSLNQLFTYSHLKIDETELDRVFDDFKLKIGYYIKELDRAIKLERFKYYHNHFPYLHLVLYEMAIANDELGNTALAAELNKSALLLNPSDYLKWHSMAVIARASVSEEEAFVLFVMGQEPESYS